VRRRRRLRIGREIYFAFFVEKARLVAGLSLSFSA
jgi:hypothetical protein